VSLQSPPEDLRDLQDYLSHPDSAGGAAVFLDQPPGGLAVEVAPDQPGRARCHRPEERAFLPDPSEIAYKASTSVFYELSVIFIYVLTYLVADVGPLGEPHGRSGSVQAKGVIHSLC
jgi:hypothetical protein